MVRKTPHLFTTFDFISVNLGDSQLIFVQLKKVVQHWKYTHRTFPAEETDNPKKLVSTWFRKI